MKPRSFIALAAVTAVTVLVALAAVAGRQWSAPSAIEVRPFPQLYERINEVAEITVRRAGGAFSVRRTAQGWGLAERGGYPVRGDKVKQTAIAIAELVLSMPKTRKPERYPRLQVEDIDAKGARSKLVTVKAAGGETLAELIVGRAYSGAGTGGVYVRLPGDEQAWLTEVPIDVGNGPVDWLERRIIHVSPKRVARFMTVQPDGEKLVLYKDSADDEHFMFEDLPEDTVLKGENVADDTGSALLAVDLTDVAPAGEIDFSGDTVARAQVRTFDGLVVDVEMTTVDGATWARFAASAEPVTALSGAQAGAASFKSADQVAAEAAEIMDRVGGWAYKLENWQAAGLRVKLAQFLEAESFDMPEGTGMPGGMGGPGGGIPGGMPGGMDPFGSF